MPHDPNTTGRRAWRSRLSMAAVSLGVSATMLGLLEATLRLAGVGDVPPERASRLEYQHVDLPILRPATRADGTPILRTVDPRLPYRAIPSEKPAGALRVFAFGGSATAGLGFSPNVTFPRYLEEMLREAYPQRHVEVINLGIVALASGQVRVLVEDVCQHADPDLLLVYSGNNEFLEIHARKYAEAHGGPGAWLRHRLADTNLYRMVLRFRDPSQPASVSESTEEELRLSEATIIADIEMSEDDVADTLDAYEANMEAIARSATRRRIPLLLMDVATNWRWRGRSDLPETWLADLVGSEGPLGRAEQERALEILDGRLTDESSEARHEDLFGRAIVHEALGNVEEARRDYRAAMNADPHLRRALDAMGERVAGVAERTGASYLSTVSLLSDAAHDGIVGFDQFYDYVHFTPRGAATVAAAVFRRMQAMELVPGADFDPARFLTARLKFGPRDALDVRRWIGYCFEPDMITDRDLWKYDRTVAALDQRIRDDEGDALALAYRGNARSFLQSGAEAAAADYRAALALRPELDAVRANLEQLLASRPGSEPE